VNVDVDDGMWMWMVGCGYVWWNVYVDVDGGMLMWICMVESVCDC